MKKIFTAAMLVAASAIANAQTTAPNWTANDCSSASHTLHTELDNGKVIVFVWVMPCGSCVNASKTAFTAVQNFATSHPGRVLFYLADDLGDASCSALSSWATSNNIGDVTKMTFFDNAGNAINMNGFGSTGMPKVVVMGGNDHKIFFNKNNSAANDATGINNAIASAIDAATSVSEVASAIKFSVSPNPVADRLTINYNKPVKQVVITAVNGQVVKQLEFGSKMDPAVDMTGVTPGVYLVKITGANGESGIQKIVKQ
ncbi:T9SS type A sorting domain-containing protein [Polluticoccus soli]|uniref:T9SS type A sorting domain-containing protein n=1 Tax=Polluticoccus soli TaxID=3034150 RepID=UPI0023E1AE4B|nr:T9SS type A sorting domain-containing protein [Flavipsychrobacter sp. JY13-12]